MPDTSWLFVYDSWWRITPMHKLIEWIISKNRALLYVRWRTIMLFAHLMWWDVTTCRSFFSSFVQGYLPGLILKGFMLLVPYIVMFLSKCEGHLAYSRLEHEAASKYYYFVVVNVFFGSILTGSAFSQLSTFINSSSITGWAKGILKSLWNHEYNCLFSHVRHNTSQKIHHCSLDIMFHMCFEYLNDDL